MTTTLACLLTERKEAIGLIVTDSGEMRWQSETPGLAKDAAKFVPLGELPAGIGNPVAYAIKRLARFMPGTHTVIAENLFRPGTPPRQSSEVFESGLLEAAPPTGGPPTAKSAGGAGFTGTDAHGHKWEAGEQVAKDKDAPTAKPTAKLHGKPVEVIARDSTHGLVRVKGADGDKVVSAKDLDMGGGASPAKPKTPAQSAHEQNQLQQQKKKPGGEGEGTLPTAEAASAQADGHIATFMKKYGDAKASVGDFLKRTIDKVPGGQMLREKTSKANDTMKARYGDKAAAQIISRGVALTWGAFFVGPLVGYPNYIPTAIAVLPFIALAELHHQMKKITQELPESAEPDPAEELSAEEIEQLAQDLVKELTEAWEEERKKK